MINIAVLPRPLIQFIVGVPVVEYGINRSSHISPCSPAVKGKKLGELCVL